VPDRVRGDTPASERWHGVGRDGGVLLDDVVDAQARERLTLRVEEDLAVGSRRDGGFGEEATQRPRGARPERADALLLALAAKQDLRRPGKVQVGSADSGQLLDARARVVEEQEYGVVAPAGGGGPIGTGQECLHLVLLQVRDGPDRRALEGGGADVLAVVGERRLLGRDKREEAADRGEPVVSRCDSVAPLPLQVVKEVLHDTGIEIGDLQANHGAPLPLRDEAEQELHGVAVRQDGQRAHAPLGSARVKKDCTRAESVLTIMLYLPSCGAHACSKRCAACPRISAVTVT